MLEFPFNCQLQLFYRSKQNGRIWQASDFRPQSRWLVSEKHGFALQLGLKEQELSIQLKRTRHSDVWLESLALVLKPGDLDSTGFRSDIPHTTRFQVFKQGYQGASISNRKLARDRNAWSYHETSITRNPEQPEAYSLYSSPVLRKIRRLPPRGCLFSDGMLHLEEIVSDVPYEWDSDQQIPVQLPIRLAFAASHAGQQGIRFFVKLNPQNEQLEEWQAIWDFSGRLMPDHGRLSLTRLSWCLEKNRLLGTDADVRMKRRTSPYFLSDYLAGVARKHHVRIYPRNLFRIWLPAHRNPQSFQANLECAKEQKLEISHFVVPSCITCDRDGIPQSYHPEFNLQEIASMIRKAGFKPLIQLRPFQTTPKSAFLQAHPELALMGVQSTRHLTVYNQELGHNDFVLDPTHPRFRSWMRTLIQSLVGRHMFDGFYLDNLYLSAMRGDYYNKQSSGAGRLRESLLWIRRQAGKKSVLVAANCPLWPAIGVIDGMQSSGDFGHKWQSTRMHRIIGGKNKPAVRKALINIINHSVLHNRLWKNTSGALELFDTRLSGRQFKMLAAIVALSGNALVLSDDLNELDQKQMQYLRKMLEINRDCHSREPIPLMMSHSHFPRGLWNPAGYLGIWNPTEHSERIEVTIPQGIALQNLRNRVNLWGKHNERVAWRLEQDRFSIALSPFDSIVIRL